MNVKKKKHLDVTNPDEKPTGDERVNIEDEKKPVTVKPYRHFTKHVG